jgi:Chaperone of endosialidase
MQPLFLDLSHKESLSMTTAQHFALTLAVTFFALLASVQAQTPRMATVNIRPDADKVHISAIGDVYEMRMDVADEQGEVVFQSGQITGQQLDWKMTDAQGERVAAGTYLVTVTFRSGAGKLRKRVEQVTVAEDEKASARVANVPTPTAAQATITGSGTTNRIAKFTGAATIGNSVIVESAGKVGIGTAGPTSLLTVVGATANSPAILTSSSAEGGVGIKGTSLHPSGIGLWGLHRETTGTTPAVKGETNSSDPNAVAVLGVVNPTTGGDNSAAVRGINRDTSLLGCGVCGSAVGVWGEQAGNGRGVYGFAPGGVGVYGNSNSGTGVYAQSSSGTGVAGHSGSGDGVVGSSSGGYAGNFSGKVKVTGMLEAEGGLTVTGGCTGCARIQSDRNLKSNISTINPRLILDRLSALSIKSWNYRSGESSVRHIGPMAQDFRAAFNLGVDDKHIDLIDANGVTMAAIQGLYQQNQELARTVQQQSHQIEQLQVQHNQLKRAIKRKRTARR